MLGIRQPILYSTATVSEAEFMDFLHTVGPQIGKLSHDKLFQEHGDVYHIYRNGGRSNLYIRFQEVDRELRAQQECVEEEKERKVRVKREYVGDAYPGDAHLDEMMAREEGYLSIIEQRIARATQFLQAEPKTTVLVALDGEKDEEKHDAQQMMLEFLIKFAERFPQCVVESEAVQNAKLWSIEELVRLHEAQADPYELSKEEVLENPWHDYYDKLVCTVNINLTTSAVISQTEWITFLDELDEHMAVADSNMQPAKIYASQSAEDTQYIEFTGPANVRDFSRKMHLLEPIERLFGHTPETAFGMRLTYHRDEEPDTRLIVTLACAMAERYPNVIVADPDPERILRIIRGNIGSFPIVRGADIVPWRLYSTEELLALHKQGKGLNTYWSPTAPKSKAGSHVFSIDMQKLSAKQSRQGINRY